MFSRIRAHINATTLIAVFALVFAMTGGAFAVTSKVGSPGKAVAAKSKAKTKTARGPAGPRGTTGPVGPAGSQGAQGVAGSQGLKGETGAAGTNGTAGVKGDTGPQGPAGPQGRQGEQGETGPAGTTGFTKTLPAGETETGTWVAGSGQVEEIGGIQHWYVPVSFSIPLKTGLDENHVHYVKSGEHTTACPGSAELPKAGEGQFCLYQGYMQIPVPQFIEEHEVVGEVKISTIYPPETSPGTKGAGTAGALVIVSYKGPVEPGEPIIVQGSWAVTAPQ